MKVLFVITGLGVGGAERQVVDIADRLITLGYKIKICYLTGPCLVRPCSEGVELIGLHMQKTPAGFIKAYLSLRKIIKNFLPDVVHSHMVHANLMVRMIRLTTEMPRVISTAHNTNEGGKLRMLGYRITNYLADVTTNVSTDAVHAFENHGAIAKGAMLAVPNGIDTDRFRPSDSARSSMRHREKVAPDEMIIVAIGRLYECKDYSNLLQAYSKIHLSIDKLRLWIIGDGPLKQRLLQQASALGIADSVFFYGNQGNVSDWLNAADVFVLSSAWEGFGLVVAEAMACEKVIVATDAGGVKEVVGDCGITVPPRDSQALAEALIKALTLRSEEMISLGQRSRNRIVNSYSLSNVVNKWVEIYSSTD